jgi:hypothetical protein
MPKTHRYGANNTRSASPHCLVFTPQRYVGVFMLASMNQATETVLVKRCHAMQGRGSDVKKSS